MAQTTTTNNNKMDLINVHVQQNLGVKEISKSSRHLTISPKLIPFTQTLQRPLTELITDGEHVTRSDVVKDLGIYFDSRLSFRFHIDEVVKHSLSLLGFIIRQCRDFTSTEPMKMLFNAYIISRLQDLDIIYQLSASSSSVQFFYQNVRGLRSKVIDFYNNVCSYNGDIIVLTETWLTNDISDSELFPDNYFIFRHDRDIHRLNLSRGSGVLLAVANKFLCQKIDLSMITEILPIIDIIGVKLSFNKGLHFYIFAIYIPPWITSHDYELLFNILSTVDELNKNHVIIIGDFNLPMFNTNIINNYGVILNNFYLFFNLSQYNEIVNSHNRVLDLIFSTNNCLVDRSNEPLVPEDPHHPALDIFIQTNSVLPMKFQMNSSNKIFNFKKADFHKLYNQLVVTDWSFLQSSGDVNDACTKFYDTLTAILEDSVPKISNKPKRSSNYPDWFDNTNIRCLRDKHYALKQYKKHKSQHHFALFKQLRSKSKKLIYSAHKRYLFDIQESITVNPNRFWTFIQKKKGSTRIPGLMNFNNQKLTSPEDIVNAFGEYFKSVYNPSNVNINIPAKTLYYHPVSVTTMSQDEVIAALKSSKDTLITGFDGIPSFFLKDCADIFAKPLLYIFNLILKTSTVPNIWKKSFVCPIFKKGDIDNIQNYRSIPLMCPPI
ncbi:uncharacterized protein LOC135143848 [Zophobas morio]|uniref:uncharacterized protein LOC135143848 n=1 Tax=Zophobas morio TaxID=2755281 RepID=UPI003082F334